MATPKEKIDTSAELAASKKMAERYRLNFIELEKFPIDYALVQSLPVDLMLRNKFVPLIKQDDHIVTLPSSILIRNILLRLSPRVVTKILPRVTAGFKNRSPISVRQAIRPSVDAIRIN